jgi:hypothetical protein
MRVFAWRLWRACLVVLVFATVFGFVPLLPWGGICGQPLFLWWSRLSGRWPQAPVEPILRDRHDLLEGDVMLLARFRVAALNAATLAGAGWLSVNAP